MRRRTEMIMITFVRRRRRRRLTRLSSASSCLLRDLVGERLGEREADLGDIVIIVIRRVAFTHTKLSLEDVLGCHGTCWWWIV